MKSPLLSFGLSGVFCTCLLLGLSRIGQAQDWNQWRGAQRNGIDANSPTLAESWPEAGPKQVWVSETIPSYDPKEGSSMGGFSCLSLSGNRGFVYVNWKEKIPVETRKLGAGELQKLGWSGEKIPEDISKAVEEARVSSKRTDLKTSKEIKEWVDNWLKDNLKDEKQKKSSGPWISDRLTRGASAWPLEVLDKLTAIKDKEFADSKEFEKWVGEQGFTDAQKVTIIKAAPVTKDVAQDVILCLDANTGKILWKKAYPGTPSQWGTSSTPAVVGDKVYVAGPKTIYCLAAADGKEIWKVDAKGGDLSSSPAVVDGVVVILAGKLLGLDPETGKTLWEQAKVTGGNPSPALWTTPSKTYLICNAGGGAACVDPKKGDVLWTVPGGGCATAAVGENALVIYNQNLAAYKLNPEKPEAEPVMMPGFPKVTTTQPQESPPEKWGDRGSTPLIYQGHVYGIGSGKAFCVQLSDGKVKWQEKFNCEIASPILADGKILGFVEGGKTFLMFKANPEKFDLLVKNKNLKMSSCSSPTIQGGKLYLRQEKAIGCYDLVHPGESGTK